MDDDAASLLAFLLRKRAIAAQRAEQARALSAARKERIRAGIRLAIGALPTAMRGVVTIIEKRIAANPDRYELNGPVDPRTIRSEVRAVNAERTQIDVPVLECPLLPVVRSYASASTTRSTS